ncbi:MAG: hypothetical protein ACHQ49_17145, partial [Elusimicrobiota bacterium]
MDSARPGSKAAGSAPLGSQNWARWGPETDGNSTSVRQPARVRRTEPTKLPSMRTLPRTASQSASRLGVR